MSGKYIFSHALLNKNKSEKSLLLFCNPSARQQGLPFPVPVPVKDTGMCAKHARRGLHLHYIHYRLISVIYRDFGGVMMLYPGEAIRIRMCLLMVLE